jgi:hypothetical protein
MYELENDELKVRILDPQTNRERLGSRYCTGGYIWQITDRKRGELLAGPQFPKPKPNSFDGQGAPEAFRLSPGSEYVEVGHDTLVIGVGMVRRSSPNTPFEARDNPEVSSFAEWDVRVEPERATMRTEQAHNDWRLSLSREVSLHRRRVESTTYVRNDGNIPLPLVWFPHPFYPPPAEPEAFRLNQKISLDESAGFAEKGGDTIIRRGDYDWSRGKLDEVVLLEPGPLEAVFPHPLLGEVRFSTSYTPSRVPVWGNAVTISLEPYVEVTVPPGMHSEWSVAYDW